ncbi:MAG: MlaA family lipoprotein, partial [Chthoniobacterales bacterium]
MKTLCFLLCLALLPVAGCAHRDRKEQELAAPSGKGADGKATVSSGDGDDWDDEANVRVLDPIEPVNRGIFWFNHQLYTFIGKPFSSAYKFLFPELLRKGIRNAYENVRFPVRFVNHTLQGRFDRTAQETG